MTSGVNNNKPRWQASKPRRYNMGAQEIMDNNIKILEKFLFTTCKFSVEYSHIYEAWEKVKELIAPPVITSGCTSISAPESRACTCALAKLPHFRSVSSEHGVMAVSLSLEVNKTCPIHAHWFTLEAGA